MIGFFLATTILVAAMHLAMGMITPAVLAGYGAAFPGLALGLWAGMRCYGHVGDALYRRIIALLLLFLGLVLLAKGVGWLR